MTETVSPGRTTVERDGFAGAVGALVGGGGRLVDLFVRPRGDVLVLRAVVSAGARFDVVETELQAGTTTLPSLAGLVPGAAWLEAVLADSAALEPGRAALALPLSSTTGAAARSVGEGLFVLPYGPVRSGVFESVQWDLETIGEDIVHLGLHLHHKRRGIERAAEGRPVGALPVVAERIEGVASVAHAIAACEAVERLAGLEVPEAAAWARLAHLELERLANHVDSMARHAEAAGQAVALARLGVAKEHLLRLRASWCGHRFGRGAVVPGGLRPPLADAADVRRALSRLVAELWRDVALLMVTPSFLDRLRRTGVLSHRAVVEAGALGPVGRGSGLASDARVHRPSGAYAWAAPSEVVAEDGDALARQQVRVGELIEAARLADVALGELERRGSESHRDPSVWAVPVEAVPDGLSVGWAEAAQGEVVATVEVEGDRVASLSSRSASLVNLALFSTAFGGDIFTDFAFIEASFGLSIAGAAR